MTLFRPFSTPISDDPVSSPRISDDPVLPCSPEGSITAPADHPFAFTLLFEKAGVTLLKVMRQSAADLQR